MDRDGKVRHDEIGPWSEIKLDIIKRYAKEYSKILTAQDRPKLYHVYIDAFAGSGIHFAKRTKEFVPGSPLNALLVTPPFREYHFIDIDSKKVASLEEISAERGNVHIYHGDCNRVLREKVLPTVRYDKYQRALCVLDPYGLHLDWEVIAMAGASKAIEIFLNFPILDMNRNVLWRNRHSVDPREKARMTRFWGDDSWEEVAYKKSPQLSIFGDENMVKAGNEEMALAFKRRLRDIAGFSYVAGPKPMKNSANAIVYYLMFATQKPVASKIVKYIFEKNYSLT